MYDPHDDEQAAEMQRIKGLVIAQAAEVEVALEQIAKRLEPTPAVGYRTMGRLAKDIRRLLDAESAKIWSDQLHIIDQAVKNRNQVAHNPVRIGSSWRDYATGGGEWVAVVSTIGSELYDEYDLRKDLVLQQDATEAAVRILHSTYMDPNDSCPDSAE